MLVKLVVLVFILPVVIEVPAPAVSPPDDPAAADVFTLPPIVTEESALMEMAAETPVPPATDKLTESATANEPPAVRVQPELYAVLAALVLLTAAQILLRPIDVPAVTITAPAFPVVPDVADSPALMEPAVTEPLVAYKLTYPP